MATPTQTTQSKRAQDIARGDNRPDANLRNAIHQAQRTLVKLALIPQSRRTPILDRVEFAIREGITDLTTAQCELDTYYKNHPTP